ncbi:hypothetical protein V2G26_009375 [Clonostachys chloroleuca]
MYPAPNRIPGHQHVDGSFNEDGDLKPMMAPLSGSAQQLPLPPAPSSAMPSTTASAAKPAGRVDQPPISTACITCRTRHQKCDGKRPCSRCIIQETECTYVASRRGYRGPRVAAISKSKKQQQLRTLQSVTPEYISKDVAIIGPSPPPYTLLGSAPATQAVDSVPFYAPTMAGVFDSDSFDFAPMPPFAFQASEVPFAQFNPSLPHGYSFVDDGFSFSAPYYSLQLDTLGDVYLDSYYHHIHGAHAFVLPKHFLLRFVEESAIKHLLAAMRWVGSIYIEKANSVNAITLFNEAWGLIHKPDVSKDGFLIQAMMVLILGLDGTRQRDRVHKILNDLETTAVEIGINTRIFASLHGQGLPVLEESWRRTWWNLYIIDALIAGVHRTTAFNLYHVPTTVALPCEEDQYQAGTIPPPRDLEQMENSGFLDDIQEFSSFSYLIQCARYIGQMMTARIVGPNDENITRIETLLSGWRLNLPLSKREGLFNGTKLDEMMFQGYMTLHAISILLHQPHSQLDTTPTLAIDACAPNTPALTSSGLNTHTKHAIQSANEITKLITLRVSLLKHTPFFAYMITLASTVQLSWWGLPFVRHDDDVGQRIRLNLGALSKYATVWPSSEHLVGQVKGIAREVYKIKQWQQQQIWPNPV